MTVSGTTRVTGIILPKRERDIMGIIEDITSSPGFYISEFPAKVKENESGHQDQI